MKMRIHSEYNEKELKECPFCGGKARLYRKFDNSGSRNLNGWTIECEKCAAAPYYFLGDFNSDEITLLRQEVIDRWNKRYDIKNEIKWSELSKPTNFVYNKETKEISFQCPICKKIHTLPLDLNNYQIDELFTFFTCTECNTIIEIQFRFNGTIEKLIEFKESINKITRG